jgi:hypothetical protein
MITVHETFERTRDPKVCETRLAVSRDQNVVLGEPSVNVGFICFSGLPTGVMPPWKMDNP